MYHQVFYEWRSLGTLHMGSWLFSHLVRGVVRARRLISESVHIMTCPTICDRTVYHESIGPQDTVIEQVMLHIWRVHAKTNKRGSVVPTQTLHLVNIIPLSSLLGVVEHWLSIGPVPNIYCDLNRLFCNYHWEWLCKLYVSCLSVLHLYSKSSNSYIIILCPLALPRFWVRYEGDSTALTVL